MQIDFNEIIDKKLKDLEESGVIQKQIETSIEKTIMSAITGVLEDYSFKRKIEEQISKEVSDVATKIGFSAYNGFIAEKIKDITETIMREDVAQKIQKTFDDMLIMKHEGIKLSEIFEIYKEEVNDNADEQEKRDRERFTCEVDKRSDGSFHHYTVKFSEEELDRNGRPDIQFKFSTYKEETASDIYSLYLDGSFSNDIFKLGTLSKTQTLLANLYYNKTKVILDLDEIEYFDNSYDYEE